MKKQITVVLQLILVCALAQPLFAVAEVGNEPVEDDLARIQGWRSDLAYLVEQVETRHKNFTHSISRAEWEAMNQQIEADIPDLTDLQVITSFMKLLAAIGDGHTLVYPPFQGDYAFRFLPLEFYFFGDDLYVRGAEPGYAFLVGARVIRIGAMPIDEVIRRSQQYLAHDNAMQLKWITPVALAFNDVYQSIGASASSEFIELSYETSDGAILTANVESGPITRDPMGRFVPSHWVDMGGAGSTLWARDTENYYWYEYLEDEKLVYCQFNQVRDKETQSIAVFAKELSDFINQNEVAALILDIRLNNGGNNFLNRSLVEEIMNNGKINQPGKLFTIIGRRTFSAGMNLASDLEKNTATLFVGEPTGSRPNFYGEDDGFELPYSGLTGSISSRYWQGGKTPDDPRPWIAPQLPADLTAGQYRNNEDPAFQAILDYLASSSTQAVEQTR